MSTPYFVTRWDFRAPGLDGPARAEIYQRALKQAAYLQENQPQGALLLSEHHASDDGYLPSPLVAAAAVAAVTTTMPISIAAVLVNLHDPIDLAEQIAVLDHISGGRVSYTFGLGYREAEYAMFGTAWAGRGQAIAERIEVMQRAWSGEEFTYEGRPVKLRPVPVTQPHPMISYGGSTMAAAKRAAQLGLNFNPATNDKAIKQAYRDECVAQGREPGIVLGTPRGPANWFCAEDPDAFWNDYGHHLLADATAYWEWSGGRPNHNGEPTDSVEELRARGRYAVHTPAEIVDRVRDEGLRSLTSHPCCGGLPAEPSWASVRLLAEEVGPALAG